MSVFTHPEFDRHEQVLFFTEPQANLRAIVAIHNTVRGPALGGCRMFAYASEADAVRDVLRLSKGMTYKSAISRLPLGGGKSVIIGDPARDKTPELLRAFGRCLQQLNGRYIVAEDSGTSVSDMRLIALESAYVSGIGERIMPEGGLADGDPSPATAYGVFMGMKAALKMEYGHEDMQGIKVAVQGAGAVGGRLVEHLVKAGAQVYVADMLPERVRELSRRFAVTPVGIEDIYVVPVDVFSPCGFGAVLNEITIPQLQARIIAGAANNQLSKSDDAALLQQRGILYVPDFAINAGGVIDIAGFQNGLSYEESLHQVAEIYTTVMRIIDGSRQQGLTTTEVAIQMAEANFRYAR